MKYAIVLLLTVLATNAVPSQKPSLDELRDFVRGDIDLWPVFERCAPEYSNCAIAAGQVSFNEREYENAARFFLLALEQGNHHAVMGMMMLHEKQRNYAEAYAWSYLQLVYQIDGDLDKLGEPGNAWNLRTFQQAYDRLDPSEIETINQRAEQIKFQWLPILQANLETDTDKEACPKPQPVHREPPSYPARMVGNRQSGWVYAVLEIDNDGNVIDQVSLLSTHRHFSSATERALKQWKYEPLAEGSECTSQRSYTAMEFSIE